MGFLANSFMRSTWGRYIMIGLALVAGFSAWGEIKERQGGRAADARQSVQSLKTLRIMQNAGASVATDRRSVSDRLRAGRF